jgi:hypothetical protein
MNATRTRLYTLLTIGSVAAAAWLASLPAAAQCAHEQAQAPVQQVIITAKRMTPAERAAEDARVAEAQPVQRVVITAKRLRPAAVEPVGLAARETRARPL